MNTSDLWIMVLVVVALMLLVPLGSERRRKGHRDHDQFHYCPTCDRAQKEGAIGRDNIQ